MISLLCTAAIIFVISTLSPCSTSISIPHPSLPTEPFVFNHAIEPFPVLRASNTALQLSSRQFASAGNETRNGLTLDYCESGTDCKGRRKCRTWKSLGEEDTCSNGALCLCNPKKFQYCTSSEECEDGESCMATMRTRSPICVSDTAEAPRGLVPWAVDISSVPQISPEEEEEEKNLGLSLDSCRKSSDCQGKLICEYIGIFTKFNGCRGRSPCRCAFKDDWYPCFDPQDCGPGEKCMETGYTSFAVCASNSISSDAIGFREIPFTGVSNGLQFDTCRTGDDCRGGRRCLQWIGVTDDGSLQDCSDLRPCICTVMDSLRCTDTNDCVDGEVCGFLRLFSVPVCVSEVLAKTFLGIEKLEAQPGLELAGPGETAQTSPSELDENDPSPNVFGTPEADVESTNAQGPILSPTPVEDSCIDARVLNHLRPEELVFKRDVLSRVLCDVEDNCATGEHIVVVRGTPMMMQTYCKDAGCVERVIGVNSPRYRRRMRVESNSADMHFTTFSARYGTRIEERVLSAAVRIGL